MMIIESNRNREFKRFIQCSYRPQNKRMLCRKHIFNSFRVMDVHYVEHERCLLKTNVYLRENQNYISQ